MAENSWVVAFAVAGMFAVQDKPSGLHNEREITLEGGTSFDYVSVDPESDRLYVGHSPKIDILDINKGTKIGEVEGAEGAHGAIAVASLKRGFATAGQKNKLLVFDLETFKVTHTVETGQNPDALLFVPSINEVWTFNGRSKNITCIDAASLEVKKTISLEGKPEAAVEHPGKGLVYVNLEDKSSIAEISSKTHELVGTHSIAPGEAPTGLALDVAHGLLFSGCGNKKLVAVDISTWKVVGSVDIGEHCDGVVFDPQTQNAFASCRDLTGGLHVKEATLFERLVPLETAGGKTCALNPKTHQLFIASGPARGQKGAVKIMIFGP